MLKARFKLVNLTFDRKAAEAAINTNLGELLKTAAKAFVLGTFNNIPVWSGMSRASMRPIGQYLGISAELPIDRASDAPNRIPAGYSQGAFDFEFGPKVYKMTFVSRVFHYYLMENYRMPQNNYTPWESTKWGAEGFIKTIELEGKNYLPNLTAFIRRNPIKVG